MGFNWVDDADKSKSHTWWPTVKKRIKAHEEKISWQTRSLRTHVEEFSAWPNAARIYMYIDVSTVCPGVSCPPLSIIVTLFIR